MTEHTQVKVTTPEGLAIEVDTGMANILAGLWRLGIKTRFSCQCGGDGQAYINFDDVVSADAFARLFKSRAINWEASNVNPKDGLRITVRMPPEYVPTLEKRIRTLDNRA